jgi:hypothetical protein
VNICSLAVFPQLCFRRARGPGRRPSCRRRARRPAGDLTIGFAAKRSPAAVSALQDPAAKALVAVPAVGECDRESAHESAAVPFVPAA